MKFNKLTKIKDKIIDGLKKLQTYKKNTKEYENPTELFNDWEEKLFEKNIKEETWEAWVDYEKFGRDNLYYVITIKELPISEKNINTKKIRKKIYEHLIRKIKENKFKIQTSYYIEDITHSEYKKILNKSIKNLREDLKTKLFKYQFSYEISTEKENKVFSGVETNNMINFPELNSDDLVFSLKNDFKIFDDEFRFLIIKPDKLILFEYDMVPFGS